MNMPQPLLTIDNLTHDYDGRPALANISLEVNHGERLVILGPSGCGKTSLLRIISGLMEPSAGKVYVNGEPPKAGIDTALVFQNPRLLPWRRVDQNLQVVLKRQPVNLRKQRIAELLQQVGLEEHAGKWPHELSGGMKQRLALARALAMNVLLMLLDEPFANLDPLAREDMQQVLLNLTKTTSPNPITTILVTHSVEEALVLGDRILLMARAPGHIVKEIRPTFHTLGIERREERGPFYQQLGEISSELRQLAKMPIAI